MIKINKTKEFQSWLDSLTIKDQHGGNKNAQKKDIEKARILVQKYARD
jgi:putative component of toxin-antitoxin plasmid stabilization module